MKSSWNEANIVSENNYYSEKRNYGYVPFDQSRSGFCDPKFEFSLHSGPNQSKVAIWTIHLRTWIVLGSGKLIIYTPTLFYAAKGLYYIKLKFHCNSKDL